MTETADPARIRLDKWLWHARIFKTRVLAAEVVSKGKIRINGQKTNKPGRAVGPGDVLTIVWGGQVRTLRLLACGTRRGPATEAAALYTDPGQKGDAGPEMSDRTERPF